ncbi:GNAT family N-acetyltransferase [Clostridium sp. JS66]|uniref:GNAT family N-acetyltransferase n=1 Tax=Clostridium sp. JS66 TaxID=3064705 RepID=UPI00298D88D9|nr:GNAT family N-acetyltransferase [Clostridium sp. JS66]WPC40322.1 GNAT family N-acetyltransferase [Clostridium sp. JS66]
MIRTATINDIDSIVKLRIQLLKEAKKNTENYNWEKYLQVLKCYYNENLLNEKVVAFLDEENESIVAMSIMCLYNISPSLFNLDGKRALITDMYTVPKYRNKGIGNKLLINIMEYAKKLGYTKVTLNSTDDGRKLYEKYGFKDITGEMYYKFI